MFHKRARFDLSDKLLGLVYLESDSACTLLLETILVLWCYCFLCLLFYVGFQLLSKQILVMQVMCQAKHITKNFRIRFCSCAFLRLASNMKGRNNMSRRKRDGFFPLKCRGIELLNLEIDLSSVYLNLLFKCICDIFVSGKDGLIK